MLCGDVESDDADEDVDVKRSRCSCCSINRAASRSTSSDADITCYRKMTKKEHIISIVSFKFNAMIWFDLIWFHFHRANSQPTTTTIIIKMIIV